VECFYPRAQTGRPRADLRQVLNGIIHRLRSGCQWNYLPDRFGASSTVHGWFQRFAADGLLEEIWAYLLTECQELDGVRWEWQAADGVMGKSRFDGAKRGPNPTDRAKMGTKKHVLVEQHGGPLGVVIAGANITTTSCSRTRSTRSSFSVPTLNRSSSTSAWTRPRTTRAPTPSASRPGTWRTSAGSARRSSTPRARRPIPHADGSSSEPSPGYKNAGHSLSATTRTPPTTSDSSNSPAHSSGTANATNSNNTPKQFSDRR
jgi:transposase